MVLPSPPLLLDANDLAMFLKALRRAQRGKSPEAKAELAALRTLCPQAAWVMVGELFNQHPRLEHLEMTERSPIVLQVHMQGSVDREFLVDALGPGAKYVEVFFNRYRRWTEGAHEDLGYEGVDRSSWLFLAKGLLGKAWAEAYDQRVAQNVATGLKVLLVEELNASTAAHPEGLRKTRL